MKLKHRKIGRPKAAQRLAKQADSREFVAKALERWASLSAATRFGPHRVNVETTNRTGNLVVVIADIYIRKPGEPV